MMKLKNLLLTMAACSSLVACIKEPMDEEQNPATVEQVQTALSKAWGNADPLTMAPNDFLFQETEQKIDSNGSAFFVLQEGITVSKREETATDYLYTYLYQNKVIKQGTEGAESTREDHRTVSKGTAAATSLQVQSHDFQSHVLKPMADDYQMTLGFERFYGLAYACVKSDALDTYCKDTLKVDSCEIKCSNLKEETVVETAPELMKAQDNCAGLPDCKLNIKKVAFDWVIELKTGQNVERQRVNYWVKLSPDLPFMSRMTEYCYRQLYPVQNQKVLVTTCTKLKNFKKGTP
ncbi:hypothetical protein [Bdellovibrio reynosensis]|uniref:Lipoprotein n=1 Tax=Bdellovibrio reynosensis TaxID=2835041 RepID=A0ABY4C878_9BACT|nr:hypothetical protein [Bdellovibrio reynosensis]UOE99880.1 hypothetical protein MNR06_09240 [Bdellovibrio reynosensis]